MLKAILSKRDFESRVVSLNDEMEQEGELAKGLSQYTAKLFAESPEMLRALKWLIAADDAGLIEQGQEALKAITIARGVIERMEETHA